jgi:hypothetical protein
VNRRNWLLWLCFLAIFSAVAWALGPDFIAAIRSYTWKEAPCTIIQAAIIEEPFSRTVTHFVLRPEYTYRYQGREYRSTRYTSGKHQGSTDVTDAEQARARFAPGSPAKCYVNPRNPNEAVLKRGELWGGLFLLAPFMIVGLMTHEEIFGWFERRRRQRYAMADLPLSEANEAMQTDRRLVFFAILSLLLGTFFIGFCIVHPLRAWNESRDWIETPAVITHCEVTSHSSQHGPQYSVELTYTYEVAGQQYRSGRRAFGIGIDEPVADLTAWVQSHPVGAKVRCFVNPRDPTEAVLKRTFRIGWVSAALGLLMLGTGAAMGWSLWRARKLRRQLAGPGWAEICIGKPQSGAVDVGVWPPPLLRAVGCGIAALALSVPAVWSLQKGIRALLNSQGDIINLLYGAAAVVGAAWLAIESLRNLKRALWPRPALRLFPGSPRVGGSFKLECRFRGPQRALSWLAIHLEGTEEAKVREFSGSLHGTISEEKTHRSTFLSLPIVKTNEPALWSGRVDVAIPADTMHSFSGAKCGINWKIKIEFGRGGQDRFEYTFPIRILPGKS